MVDSKHCACQADEICIFPWPRISTVFRTAGRITGPNSLCTLPAHGYASMILGPYPWATGSIGASRLNVGCGDQHIVDVGHSLATIAVRHERW